jgi:hypothetical protein
LIAATIGRPTTIRAVVEKDAATEFTNGLATTMRPTVEKVGTIAPAKDRTARMSALAVVERIAAMVAGTLRTEFILAEETPNPHAI